MDMSTYETRRMKLLTEEIIQVHVEILDLTIRANERQHLPIRIGAFP